MLSFVHPAWLFCLLMLPLIGVIHWQWVQRERAAFDAFARTAVRLKMQVNVGLERRLWRGLLVLMTLAAGLVALAQPRWGASQDDGMAGGAGNLVLVLDISRSMRARDIGGESRLKASQDLIEQLLPSLAGWNIGVVAFAGEAEALVPLTTDHAAVQTLLARAQPGMVPGRGSNMEAGLKAALPLFNRPGRRVLALFSDGEELAGSGVGMAAALRQAKVEVLAVGMGTLEGAFIPGETDVWGTPTFVTFQGNRVTSHLEERGLQQLAEDTGGQYGRGSDGDALDVLRNKLAGPGVTPELASPSPGPVWGHELFQVPLILALVFYLLDTLVGAWRRRRPHGHFADHVRLWLNRPRVANAERGATSLVWLLLAPTLLGWTWFPSWLPNGEAARSYQARDYERAQQLLTRALAGDPANFRLSYNLGNVHYQQQHYVKAEAAYQQALETADDQTRPLIGYNLGNAYFRRAETSQDSRWYSRAIQEYERVLAAVPKDEDARYNLELAKKRLEQARKNSKAAPGAGNGNAGQGQGQNPPGMPRGTSPTYKPPPPMKNLPSKAEVDALLKALESDERRRQAEQGAEQQPNDGDAGQGAQQLLQQALGGLDLQKDW